MPDKQENLTVSTVLQIAEGTSHEIGEKFHAALIETLSRVMKVSLVLITRGEGYPAHTAQTLYCWREGAPAENFSYELDGTPCAFVYGGDRITIPCELGLHYPKEAGFEGYCGVPLLNRHRSIVGHFAVLSKAPFEDVGLCEIVMRIFGSRVEAELQRAAADRDRDALVQSLSHARDRLEQQREASRAANSFKSDLVAITMHDLRNPLTAIMNRAELITTYLSEELDLPEKTRVEKATKSADEILNTSERMEKMISEVLDSSRADATDLSYAPALFDLSKMLATVAALNDDVAAKKSIYIHRDFPQGLNVFGDEDRLIEAIDNLLSNAIKFSSGGSAVTLMATEADNATTISVRDKGVGIPAGEVEQIFDRYRDASSKPTDGETSFGLGLWIVKSITDRHGGSVSAYSDGPGHGACFTVTLPNRV